MAKNVYFSDLNYSLGNEDTNFERQIVLEHKPEKIISVCGSGSRALPLINSSTKEIILVDLAIQQLWLAKLRVELIKKCNHEEFLTFWGYAPYSPDENTNRRKEIYSTLELGDAENEYFIALFESKNWKSILYTGKWEKTFKFFSRITNFVVGKDVVNRLFDFNDIHGQVEYMNTSFPKKKWEILLRALGNKAMFNALLYKGHFIKKNIQESYLEYYSKAYNHLFKNDLAKKSFFLQLTFFGKIIHKEGNLIEAHKECFDTMKENIKNCKINYVQGDLIKTITENKDVDFISLSDVPSYFTDLTEKNFFQEIKPSLSKNAIVVNRNYLRIPNANRSGYKDISQNFKHFEKEEKIQMYRIEVLEND